MPRGLCAPRTLAAYVLPTTSYSCALSAFGARTASGINPYRIGRLSRGPVPNASKRQFGSANLGSPGPLYDKATQRFQSESCLWAAGGARTQARRSTGDVVGGLPPEKSRGLRRGPAQGQRTEVGRIRSCCQGWTRLPIKELQNPTTESNLAQIIAPVVTRKEKRRMLQSDQSPTLQESRPPPATAPPGEMPPPPTPVAPPPRTRTRKQKDQDTPYPMFTTQATATLALHSS